METVEEDQETGKTHSCIVSRVHTHMSLVQVKEVTQKTKKKNVGRPPPTHTLFFPTNRIMSASLAAAPRQPAGGSTSNAWAAGRPDDPVSPANSLENGNADEEAEELIPGPNF
jgi:hypothetical protein